MNILDDLAFRGLIHQTTDRDGLQTKLSSEAVKLYAGFDPTADSLHIGHLLPILTLRRFQQAGHIPFALVGGATGLIGDPTGRSEERPYNTGDTVDQWTRSIKSQLSRFLDFDHPERPARVFNNYDWFSSINVIDFLRDTGVRFTVNYMLAKETVQTRLPLGISFTEMSYMLLQAHDFRFLHQQYDCALQIGGSDQWGNITAGLELISRTGGGDAFGLTMPLIMKSDGTKFGKTAGGAVWLDPAKTSPYQFYQFWLQTDDADVTRFLKYFTFLSHEEIIRLEASVQTAPEKREAQGVLASEVTRLVHGEEALVGAVRVSEALFRGTVDTLSATDLADVAHSIPTVSLEESSMNVIDLLVTAGAASSKRQAREDVQNGAVTINGVKVLDATQLVNADNALHRQYALIKVGKKKYVMAVFG
ncbi:tyrosyl-tRNA synthetase [Paenibacillus phyllosphaerae]|uniref:Tyrosine--tRNA ligase n=2 Tax=Paenibacillus phyllosphaerae TaxID=274593 RepID=A0A7W5B265_9BACL|nr:tyrosine--tRNA ligase [Paenibacillus phyllosphaerae]MBB3112471.1 tyrosyl-tRNA synthetase [Paenibacillus phyllosphaerae]